jgi:hypothetical protein
LSVFDQSPVYHTAPARVNIDGLRAQAYPTGIPGMAADSGQGRGTKRVRRLSSQPAGDFGRAVDRA